MRTFIVDAFTDEPFRGNPAGVCLVEADLTDGIMLRIAQELNLSETAFVRPLDAPGRYAIRYFSPKMEIPLCGHATMASARIVYAVDGCAEAHFMTVEGLDLPVWTSVDRVTMSLPVYATHPASAPEGLLAALGLRAVQNAVYNAETRILLLEIEDPVELARLTPDFAALLRSHAGINGVLVTAPSRDGRYDFHSRYFWPWSGSDEDPVTGGTHTFLTGYWSHRLGKTKLRSFQASARTGFMDVELIEGRVRITSQAIMVFEGRLLV